jgi:hypothetical protein
MVCTSILYEVNICELFILKIFVQSICFLVVGKRTKAIHGGVSGEPVNISQQNNFSIEGRQVQEGFPNSSWGYEVHINSFSELFCFFILLLRDVLNASEVGQAMTCIRDFFFFKVATSYPSFTSILQSCDTINNVGMVSI